jgi:CrcB protein
VITAAAFVLAAAAGAIARAEMGRRWNRHDGFPLGTLIVNITGSFLLGVLAGTAPPMLTVLGVGGLGSYTTFSSFARDAAALGATRRSALAGLYVVTTCAFGIGAAAAGVAIAT